MKIERKKNAARNVIWGIAEKIVELLLPFITRTVMIKVLGAEYLGLSSLFTSILSVLSISELGIGTAIVFSMYRPIAENDNETLCALLNVYKRIYRVVGSVILTVGLCLLPFLPRLIHGSYPADVNLYVLYLVYLFNTVISYFLFAYKTAIFSAFQRRDLISKRAAAVNFVSNLLKIAALLLTRNYYVYVVFIPLTTIATNLLNAWLADKYFPEIQCRGSISSEMQTGIKKRIVGLLSFKIYGVVFSSVDTLVISAFLGLTPLAIYNNYYYVQKILVGFLTIFTASITAGIGNKMVTNGPDDNYKDFKNIVFVNGWIVSWCSVCLFCLYQPFIRLWVGEKLEFPFLTMTLMVLYFLLPRITTITVTYREASGLWWEDRFRPLIATVVNLTLNIILVRVIGMDGVLLSTLACSVFINIPWGAIVLFKHYFKRSAREYLLLILYYVFITAVIGVLSFGVCSLLPEKGLLPFVGKMLICLAFPNLLFWLCYRKRKEYLYARGLAFSLLKPLLRKNKRA